MRMTSDNRLLLQIADDLARLAESIKALTDASGTDVGATPETEPKATAQTKADAKPAAGIKPLALKDVRAVLAEMSRDGYTAQIRELLIKHGAEKLSEIDPAKYPALLADAEVLGNE
jgi:geranylgeranyl pyrophosphate synthase